MKFFPPFALAILLTACAVTPEDKEAARQRQLEKEARENFIAMKAQEHPGRPVLLHDEAPPPTPKPPLISFLGPQQPVAAPTPMPYAAAKFKLMPTPAPQLYVVAQPRPKPTPTISPRYAAAPKQRTPRNLDDTVYYWQVPPPSRHSTTPRQLAAEAKYARTLAKRPENLTPEERLWAHEHY